MSITKSTNPFPPELRTAAFVPRWSILWSTLRSDIAQHSFFVAHYAWMIAKIIRWKGPQEYLILKCLYHDLDETITGDVIGTAKQHVIDKDKAEAWLETKMFERMGKAFAEFCELENSMDDSDFGDVEKIVKTADILDAILHLAVEARLGNSCTEYAAKILTAKLEGQWRALPADGDLLSLAWNTVVVPAIASHNTEGGKGV